MNKDEQIRELTALLEQERAYVHTLKSSVSELKEAQRHMLSGLEVWKTSFETLFHEHHVLAGSKRSTACNVCLREYEFPLAELLPAQVVP